MAGTAEPALARSGVPAGCRRSPCPLRAQARPRAGPLAVRAIADNGHDLAAFRYPDLAATHAFVTLDGEHRTLAAGYRERHPNATRDLEHPLLRSGGLLLQGAVLRPDAATRIVLAPATALNGTG